MDIEKIKEIVTSWASKIPFQVNVYLFGSYLKGTSKPDSDIDIAIEFLYEPEAWLLWFDVHEKWENHLSGEIGLKVDLQLYEGENSENLKAYMEDASMLLYSSEGL